MLIAPWTSLQLPLAQGVQVSAEAAPRALEYVPRSHGLQELAREMLVYVPAPQELQTAAREEEKRPDKHAMHAAALLAPGELLAVPAAHATHTLEFNAPCTVLNVPAGHGVQTLAPVAFW
jgi:hypothetical protein